MTLATVIRAHDRLVQTIERSEFAAVLNPPQGAILAVGAGEPRAIVKAGALAIATVMTCTLSVDHRVVDGAIGAEFFVAFKKLIEDPLTMLL